MKFKTALLLSLLSIAIKAQTNFERSFGNSTINEEAVAICSTSDKGFAVLGSNGNAYLLKTDSLGVKQWSTNFNIPGPYLNLNRSLMQTSDGGFVFCGTANFPSQTGTRGYIAKISSTGSLQWLKAYIQINNLNNIKETFDGGFIAAGNAPTYDKNVLVKFDINGTIVWSKIYNQTAAGRLTANDVIQLKSDSSYAVSYYYSPPPSINSYLVMANFNKNGTLQWMKQITNLTLDAPYDYGNLIERQNGEIQMYTNGSSLGVYSIKPNGSSGKSISINWNLNNLRIRDNATINNDIYVLGDYQRSAPYYTFNAFIAKLDSNGAVKWSKQYGGANEDYAVALTKTKTGGLAFVGNTKSFSSGYNDLYLFKTDSAGNSCHSTTLSISTSTQNLVFATFTPTLSSLFNTNSFTENITGTNASEILNNACVCQPPVASFTAGYCMIDNSLWADKWYWTYSNGYIDSTWINSCSNFTASGTYTVCLKVKNSCGSDSLCKTFDYVVIVWGINEQAETEKFISYPNPASTFIRFKNKEGLQINKVELFDIQGKLILEEFNNPEVLYIGELSKGVYQLLIHSENKIFRKKIVKE